MRYYEIIREGYKEVQQKYISAGIDPESIEKTFNTYKELVNRNQVSGNERNIDWWGKQSFDQFKAFVDDKSSKHSTTQLKRNKIVGKSIELDIKNDDWRIAIPLDKDASCNIGDNSDWCTAKRDQSYFEEYFYDDEVTLIYCKNVKTGGMWAIAIHKNTKIELFDKNDESISEETFNYQTGLDVDKIVAEALKHQSEISSSRDVYKEATARIKEYIKSGVGRNTQIEKDLILTKDGESCIKYMMRNKKGDYPLSIQLMAVKQNQRIIVFINNPNEKVQLVAVQSDGLLIEYIDNPSEQVQLAAVTQNGNAIKHIENSSEVVQIAAVTENADTIRWIDNPSEAVQLATVTKSGWAIEWIIKKGITPSKPVQLAAVTQNGFAIKAINNPSEEVQLAAVKNLATAIQFINNPSEKVRLTAEAIYLTAVQKDSEAIRVINNPSEKVQLAAVTQDGNAIKWIIEKGITPSEQVQLAAVTQNEYAIRWIIDNPSEAVQLAAVQKDRRAIKYINNPSEAVKKAAGL